MFCFIYKWYISRALDLGKGLPGFVTRHLRDCSACREFSRLSQTLDRGLVQDASQFLQKGHRNDPDPLSEKIIAALPARPLPLRAKKRHFLPALFPAPVLAAAVIVAAVSIGIIFLTNPANVPGPAQNLINGLTELGIGKTSLPDIAGRVESPIETEILELKQSVDSAAEFLIANLDIKLDVSDR